MVVLEELEEVSVLLLVAWEPLLPELVVLVLLVLVPQPQLLALLVLVMRRWSHCPPLFDTSICKRSRTCLLRYQCRFNPVKGMKTERERAVVGSQVLVRYRITNNTLS